MIKTSEETTDKSTLTPNMDGVKFVTRLLVDDPRTIRRNTHFFGTKFPRVVLTLSTPGYDEKKGDGSRVSYTGEIDRATKDAFEPDPFVTFESGSESVNVPVVPCLPMVADGTRIANMLPHQQELAVSLASKILVGLGVTFPAE
jgi:hypothetical protein